MLELIQKHFKLPLRCTPNTIIGLTLLFILLFDNQTFWLGLFKVYTPSSFADYILYVAVFFFIFSFLFFLVSLFSYRYLLKPTLIFLIFLSATTSYYIDSFSTIFDKLMIQNIARTDIHESTELLDIALFWHLIFYALLPTLFIRYGCIILTKNKNQILQRIKMLCLLGVISLISIYSAYKDLTFVFRENRVLAFVINPLFPIVSAYKYTRDQVRTKPPYEAVFKDAHYNDNTGSNNNVFIVVVGETARANDFELDGYVRHTNPYLMQQNIINYPHVSSCGTATAISVPCMFSWLDHDSFSNSQAENSDNILNALENAGVDILWRDNNAGCQGVCNNNIYESVSHIHLQDYCNEDGCFDEVLLDHLKEKIQSTKHDLFIVLHQQGSHGPAYYRRYPKSFARYLPECRTTAVQNCTNEEITNAYDNTILYTDYFLNQVINLLKSIKSKPSSAMMYISDHGESLGENGVYLHGLPYFMAPKQQTRVPMVLWMSEYFQKNKLIDKNCMIKNSQLPISHDNISHSVLGVMDITAKKYNADLDIFASCRKE